MLEAESVRVVEVLKELAEHIDSCDEQDLLACDNDKHSPSVFRVLADRAREMLEKPRA